MLEVLLVAALVQIAGPANQVIWINPDTIVSLRQPRSQEHFARGTRCLLQMVDGHYVATVESCDSLRLKLNN